AAPPTTAPPPPHPGRACRRPRPPGRALRRALPRPRTPPLPCTLPGSSSAAGIELGRIAPPRPRLSSAPCPGVDLAAVREVHPRTVPANERVEPHRASRIDEREQGVERRARRRVRLE